MPGRPARRLEDAGQTVFLVSCVSEKRGSQCPARDLYISDWFTKVRKYVESRRGVWFILSAEHGLLSPDRIVGPYERSLNTMTALQRRDWADRVVVQMAEAMPRPARVIFLAGAEYREHLAGHLVRNGVTVDVPMEGLRTGEQLSWLARG